MEFGLNPNSVESKINLGSFDNEALDIDDDSCKTCRKRFGIDIFT